MRTLLLLVACILFICSCGKVECPAFPEELMTWVDYKTTDTLRYKSFNDTLSHIVINNHKSERHYLKEITIVNAVQVLASYQILIRMAIT
ncbi:MAG: hypothetical protein PHF92_10025 [Bacteroidales bacterium]|nr:hypothetical protein [Bacteroidales bacterium]